MDADMDLDMDMDLNMELHVELDVDWHKRNCCCCCCWKRGAASTSRASGETRGARGRPTRDRDEPETAAKRQARSPRPRTNGAGFPSNDRGSGADEVLTAVARVVDMPA